MNKDRLLTLAEKLYTLNVLEFDFNTWERDALGYCPIVFPDDWEYRTHGHTNIFPCLKDFADHIGEHVSLDSAVQFFDISMEDAKHLFVPNLQLKIYGKDLDIDSSAEDVASNIQLFVDLT